MKWICRLCEEEGQGGPCILEVPDDSPGRPCKCPYVGSADWEEYKEKQELTELEITSMSGLAILEEGNDYTAEVEIHPSIIITQPPNAKQFIIIEGRKIYLNEEGKKKFKKVEVHWFG